MAKPNMLVPVEEKLALNLPKEDVVLLDVENPRSIINLVPTKIREAILNISENFPQYLKMSEVQLHAELRPSELDDRIRLGFWNEYGRAQDSNKGMQAKNIYGMFCNEFYFYTEIVVNPKRMAWIINQPQEYMLSLESSLNHAKNTLDKIMKMPLFDAKGKLKVVEANIFLKAYQMLDNRVKGAVLQRIEQKTATLHMHKNLNLDSEKAREELDNLRKEQGQIIEVEKVNE